MPCCFNWPVKKDGKQLVFSDRNDGYALHDQKNCDDIAVSDHTVPNDKNSSEDDTKELAGTDSAGCKGLNRTTLGSDDAGYKGLNRTTLGSEDTGDIGLNATANCEGVRTSGEDSSGVQSDATQCREVSACTDERMKLCSRPSDLGVAVGNSDVAPSSSNGNASCSSGGDSTSDPTLTDAPSSSSVTSAVPTSNQIDAAQTDSDVAELKKAPTEVMSPRSYALFKSELVHVPEMNLPWESMRKTTKCGCGVTFSYSIRKVQY